MFDNFGIPQEVTLKLDPSDTSAAIVLKEAGSEYGLEIDEFSSDTIVLDCGAGYGEFSVECVLKGAKRVVSFEPNPNLISYLLSNTTPFPSIEVQPSGAWIENTESLLYFRESGTASASIHEVQFDPNSKLGRERITKTVNLIDIGAYLDKVCTDFPGFEIALKLDIEGAEHEIISYLHESKRLWMVQKIWVEYHYGIKSIRDLLQNEFEIITIVEKDSAMGLMKAAKKKLLNSTC